MVQKEKVANQNFEYLTDDVEVIDLEIDLGELELPQLPEGYAFTGGAARSIALRQLFGESLPIRDIDITAFKELNPDISVSGYLSEIYMPDDTSRGHPIGQESLAEYFKTRDFTINEVTVVNGKIIISKQAKLDLEEKTVRVTNYEKTLFPDEHTAGPKITVKAYLMQSVLESTFGASALVYEDLYDGDISEFYLALGLNKALQLGPAVTKKFLGHLCEARLITADQAKNPFRLAVSLARIAMFEFSDSQGELQTLAETPSIDLLPVYEDPSIKPFIHKTNMYHGPGMHHIGRDEY